jgi:hypothetical protein
MPAHYAHYRFGVKALELLPPEARRAVRRFRSLYDVGLHGPDIFFYHNILFRDKVVALGKSFHEDSGEAFFTPVCKRLRLEPGEAATAYLWGLLTHYCLDSTLHGFVLEQTASGEIGHTELETEFDRFLLKLDGRPQPNTFDCSPHIHLTDGECATAAAFYTGVSPMTVKLSVKGMAAMVKILAMPNGSFRRTVEKTVPQNLQQHFMGRTPNRKCAHLNDAMLDLFDEALAKLPSMVSALEAHMSHNEPLGEMFEATFNG